MTAMQITIFGASGKVGQLVVSQLVAEGHTVQVFVHSSSPFAPNEQIKVIKSDIHDQAFVEAALRGSEAVISTLGSWHTPTKDILSAAMQSVIPAMKQAGITRIISLTGSGAWAPGDTITTANKISHTVFGLVAKKIIQDAEKHLTLLADSDLDWTVIRAPIMRRGSKTHYNLSDALPTAWELITRPAVAKAIVDQLKDTSQFRRAPRIHQAK